MGANFGSNTGLADITCEFLQAILDSDNSSGEIKSAEELLHRFSKYKTKRSEDKTLKNPYYSDQSKEKTIGSMDIKSFYPSIKPYKVAAVCRLMWNKSGVKVENVDSEKLIRYISQEISAFLDLTYT